MTVPERIVAGGLDAIGSQVAIVDATGTIVYTNRAWDDFGRENGLAGHPVGPGDDYLAVCGVDLEGGVPGSPPEREDPDDTTSPSEGTDDATRAGVGLLAVLRGDEERFSLEYPCHSPDERRWFTMRATAFEVDGDRYAIVLHVNITDRKLAELAVGERSEQLELVARVLSHDLRNPLNVAMGRLGMAGDTDVVAQQLERMEAIIDNALVVARGTSDVEPTSVSLATAARDAWTSVDTGDATLVVEDPGTIEADPRLLPHLLENLFRNSVEHGGHGVTVTVGRLPEEGFFVADDGPGLPDADVFEDGVTTGGTGMGLTIVTAVADAHGWQIRTPQGDGARFEFVTS